MNKNLKHTYLIDLHLNQLQKRYKTLVYDISCTNFIFKYSLNVVHGLLAYEI